MRSLAEQCGHSNLPDGDLLNHLPTLIEELCLRVDSRACETSEAARRAAVDHGRARKREKLSPTFLLNESTVLREAVLGAIHGNMLSLDLSSLFIELAIVSDSLDDQLKIAMEAWLAEST